ncbi:permease [Noviherbaspirillum galbum]|uniref:Permease n=1 Tax=Noviherbaspirillum galbum TaxID=2709383 RepID=A0A6B3SWY2_9BURK|nr:permease [Noviherbaspirillum galbum]NEX62269.1 permease [Noviherbaspirillum galbum]
MQRSLSLDESPAFSLPARFFLAAPVFAVLAGSLAAWGGPDVFVSRWSPLTLGIVHLLVLGFLSSVMIGALFQMLPVVAGVPIAFSRVASRLVPVALWAGTLLLAGGLILSNGTLTLSAIPLLVAALGGFGLLCLWSLRNAVSSTAMLRGVRLAVTALVAAAALGAAAAALLGTGSGLAGLSFTSLVNAHAAWGLAGWLGLLVIAVAYQVVPMFQVTPTYPAWMSGWLAPVLFVLLALTSAMGAAGSGGMAQVAAALALMGSLASFAVTTLSLLRRRKRPQADPTTRFWHLSLASLLAAACLGAAGSMMPGLTDAPAYSLVLGVLLIVGFGMSVVCGMLYKILPFLVWYHLQNELAGGCQRAPNVKQVISDAWALRHLGVHAVALGLLACAAGMAGTITGMEWKWLSHLAGLALAASGACLGANLYRAARLYYRSRPLNTA